MLLTTIITRRTVRKLPTPITDNFLLTEILPSIKVGQQVNLLKKSPQNLAIGILPHFIYTCVNFRNRFRSKKDNVYKIFKQSSIQQHFLFFQPPFLFHCFYHYNKL